MRQYLASVEPALLFLLKVTSSEQHRKTLEALNKPSDLVALANDQGFAVTSDTLGEAMKILVDRKLASAGIPSWVRSQLASF
jgi:hypothetical protein